MKLSGIRADDIVKCDVRGDRFFALVKEAVHDEDRHHKRVLTIAPLNGARQNLPSRWITARQVTEHYRKAKT